MSDQKAPAIARDVVLVWLRILLAALVVAAIMAVSGAFGTAMLAIVPRLAYWLCLTAAGAGLGIAASRILVPRIWFETRPVVAWSLIVLIICVPMTLVVAVSDSLVVHRPLRPMLIVEMFPPTLATTAAMTALAFLVRRREPVETHAAGSGAPPARFLERLPARLKGSDLWAIQAEDHYLRLHTSLGQDLILMRLGDAIIELEGIEGARTHRAWWVARAGVKNVVRAEGRATITLLDGAEAPVSRAYTKTLRGAGWF
jgi:hypothetical protein